MEDAPRRSKRPRAQTWRLNQGQESDGTDESPNQVEREASPDDFEEPPVKAKRYRSSEGTSATAHSHHQSLIEVVKGNGKLIPQAVKLWVGRYENDSKIATVELLTFLFETCGAKYYIKEELLEEMSVDDFVVALVNLGKMGEIEDFLSSKKKEFKNFKRNLVSFWDSLIVECQNGPLFDKVLFDQCMDYIIALSCTPPRVFRQVASLIGLQLVTSFITVAKVLGSQRETTQRQLTAEMKKRADGPRVESLNKRLSVTHDNIIALDDMMRKIFTGLFVHRYRDVDSNIRRSCIESLGVWILSYPSLFLKDLYLKYLGWTLNDKNAGVRKASVLGLQNLYEVDDNVPTLGLFTERFSSRMIELADDIDVSVAVSAIGLVKQLLRHQLISDDDLGPLYDLLVDDPPEVRRAIGELVYDHLITQKYNSSQSAIQGRDDNSSEVHISRMLQILREFSTQQVLSTYVMDDVWEYMKAMTDWKCIISMLLNENPRVELTDEDATNLIRLLFTSVKKAVGEKIVPITDNRKQHHNKAQKDIFESNRRDITFAMMKSYPQLLRKFMADKAKVSSLVEIIVHMNLELYSLKRQEQNFRNVLQLIKEAYFKHGEKDPLRSCVKAIEFCSTGSQGELQDFSRNKMKDLEEEVVVKLKSAIKDVADGNDDYSLLVNLKRLYELQLLRHVPIEELYDDLISILHNFRTLDEEVITFLLLNMYLHLSWSLYSIARSETVSEASLSSLILKRNIFFDELHYFIDPPLDGGEGKKYGYQLACRVCIILSDLWCLFKKKSFSSTELENLGYCPDSHILEKYWKLCEQQLNISDETEDEDANREYVEETNKDAVIIAAAKLVVTDTVPEDYIGPQIISHFVMHGTGVADIVKNLITVLKKREDDISDLLLEALKRAYQRHMEEVSRSDNESITSKSFGECKSLAARLSGTYVAAARNKHRQEILRIAKEGIEYAFVDAPKQLSFLEGAVLHFVSKLPASDVIEILKGIEKRIQNVNTDEDPSGWRPYFVFVEIVREKYAKGEMLQDEKEGVGGRRRGRPRKKRNIEGKRLFDGHDTSEDEDSISGSDHDDDKEKEDEDDEEVPLMHSIRPSSRLKSFSVSREGNRG